VYCKSKGEIKVESEDLGSYVDILLHDWQMLLLITFVSDVAYLPVYRAFSQVTPFQRRTMNSNTGISK
jgi:hypothetical protein